MAQRQKRAKTLAPPLCSTWICAAPWACRCLDVAAILARGACDVDAADADGDTALDFAVKHGHADVADFLRRRGAADRNAGRLSLSSSSNGGTSP
jgi:ankyrin repeat protein